MKLVRFHFEVKNHNNNTFTILRCYCSNLFGVNLLTAELNYTFIGNVECKNKKVPERIIKKILGNSLYYLIFNSKLPVLINFWLDVKDNKVYKNPLISIFDRLIHIKSIRRTEQILSNLLREKLLNNPKQLKYFINDKKSLKLLSRTYFDKIHYGMSVEEFVRI